MPQLSLFDPEEQQPGCQHLAIPDAELELYEHAFTPTEADAYLSTLLTTTVWRHDQITIHGKQIAIPRLQAWYADTHAVLKYSGMSIEPRPWTDHLLAIRKRIFALSGLRFNSVLVNCYRDGRDSVGWHRDNEREFGPDPIIASVSFGASRDFLLKHLRKKELTTIKYRLTHGSLLVMGRGTQTHWQHQLPKRKNVTAARINLTFRNSHDPTP